MYALSQSCPANFDDLLRFLDKHKAAIADRPEDQLGAAIETGQILYFANEQSDEIVGASAYFDYEFEHKDEVHLELGATVFDPPIQGFGLHKLCLSLRLGNLRFHEGEESIFTVVKADNVISQKTLVRWLAPWDEPPQHLLDARSVFSEHQDAKLFLQYIHERDADIAGLVLEYTPEHVFTHRKQEKPDITVRINHPLVVDPEWQETLRAEAG